MTNDEFIEVVESRFKACKAVLTSKGDEYGSEDRLSNFKNGAGLLGVSPEECLIGFAVKHFESVAKFAKDKTSGFYRQYDFWAEKINDIVNYMILLDALLCEERNNNFETGGDYEPTKY